MREQAIALISRYCTTFNLGDIDAFLNYLTADVAHDINQGAREIGRQAFAAFMQRMNRCYQEEITDLVIMAN
jgi:steroid delta-isomerase-like uncharacterized protein